MTVKKKKKKKKGRKEEPVRSRRIQCPVSIFNKPGLFLGNTTMMRLSVESVIQVNAL